LAQSQKSGLIEARRRSVAATFEFEVHVLVNIVDITLKPEKPTRPRVTMRARLYQQRCYCAVAGGWAHAALE
jgi:hypothetical protein